MNKKQKILELVKEYVEDKRSEEKWEEGQDWVPYSGPVFDSEEYIAAIDTLLSEWLIVGKESKKFEDNFPAHLGMKHGVLTNSGSSANLLMVSAAASRNLFNLQKGAKVITPVVCFPTTINPII